MRHKQEVDRFVKNLWFESVCGALLVEGEDDEDTKGDPMAKGILGVLVTN